MHPKLAIYCDFDGTVTTRDTVDFLLEQLATPEWEDIEAQWEEGLISSRECMARQIPLIQGGWAAIESLLPEVEIDPTFAGFVQWCQSHRISLTLVSEGLDRVIHALLDREGIQLPVWANHLEENAQGKLSLSFPNAPSDPRCQSGLCKCKVINQPLFSSNPDIHRVVIGDGMSDRCWSEEADTLFAKSKLVQYCQENKIPFIPFDHFQTIQAVLETQLRPFPKPSIEVLNLAPIAKSVSHR